MNRSIARCKRLGAGLLLTCALTLPSAALANPPAVWAHDVNAAFEVAQLRGSDVLVLFTADPAQAPASASSGPAADVPAAVASALVAGSPITSRFILVQIPFPSASPEAAPRIAAHINLLRQFNIDSLPQLVLLDSQGRPYAKLPCDRSNIDLQVTDCLRRRGIRDAALAAADKETGLPRARHLAAALAPLPSDLMFPHYRTEIEAIIAADPDNAAGLSGPFRDALTEQIIDEVIQQQVFPLIDRGEFSAARLRVQRLIEELSPSPPHRQSLLGFVGQLQINEGKTADGIATLTAAIAMAPESETGRRLQTLLDSLRDQPAAP
jgi:hypothetical protein